MKYDIQIKRVSNGVVVKYTEGQDVIYKFDEEDKAGLLEMIFDILEELEPNNKYNKENVQIAIVHGRDYECKDKQCKICKGED